MCIELQFTSAIITKSIKSNFQKGGWADISEMIRNNNCHFKITIIVENFLIIEYINEFFKVLNCVCGEWGGGDNVRVQRSDLRNRVI